MKHNSSLTDHTMLRNRLQTKRHTGNQVTLDQDVNAYAILKTNGMKCTK